MELLAPAGDFPCLEAAIEAGADAVYLGLSLLNARRGAKNFTPESLAQAVELAGRHDAAVHLALNTDISRRETGAAARILAMAREIGVAAVIARDWAVVGLWRAMSDAADREGKRCPALHLSTQTAITNVEGARLARDIGVSRIVLARELSLAEIRDIAGIGGLEIEVFAQGALCYSVSGRCLMSSWGGGRSGNRGLCASPCRVPWAVDGETVGAAMSMRDLVTVDRLRELAGAGVDAIKIEGRLKKPEWVSEAVTLYRQALGTRKTTEPVPPPPAPGSVERAKKLAAYAGRDVTSSYLDGTYSGLTGVAARKSSRGAARKSSGAAAEAIDEFLADKAALDAAPARARNGDDAGYALEITVTDKALSCRCVHRGKSESWRLPKTVVKRENKALSLAGLFQRLRAEKVGDIALDKHYTNEPEFLIPPRNVKAIVATLGSLLKRLAGTDDDGSDAVLKAPLPDEMRPVLAAPEPHAANRRRLGERPNQARLMAKQINSGLFPTLRDVELIVQNATPADVEAILRLLKPDEFILAFPEVYFPGEGAVSAALAELCRAKGIRAEANCWGSLRLCREYGLDFSAGPGLPVLNHLAVKCLRDLGAAAATISMEADRRQIEDLSASAPLPLTLLVYARPVLAHTRIPKGLLLPENPLPDNPPADPDEHTWTDRRGISLRPETGFSTTFFRSLTPFDWCGLVNEKIRVANLAVDLSGESRPVDTWKRFHRPNGRPGFLFNYDRGLK